MKRCTCFAVLAVACSFFAVGQAFSQQPAQPTPGAKPAAAQPTQPTPPAKPAEPAKPADKPAAKPTEPVAGATKPEEMAKMMEYATPGAEHAALKPLVGTFTCDCKFWMAPGAPPDASSGTLTRKMILGDRFVAEDYQGTAMGQPFSGHGLLGYDKAQKKYVSIWIDTWGTGIMEQTGSASGKLITFEGENYNSMSGKKEWGKSTCDMSSNEKQIMKMFSKGPDGKEFQNFEMTCTRK